MAKKKGPKKSRHAKLVVNNDAELELTLKGDEDGGSVTLTNQPDTRQQDVVINIGDMTRANPDRVKLDAGYEAMVEDIIGNFNHIVAQGIDPMTALFAMTQAYAVVLGCCLRANMDFEVAKKLQIMVMKNAQAASKAVRIIT